MKVQEVILKDGRKRYLLVKNNGPPVDAAAGYLKLLDITGKSSNTQKTYCYALKVFFEYLEEKQLSYQTMSFRNLVEFLGWLQYPQYNKSILFIHQPRPLRCEKTANLIMSVVKNFYEYLYRNDKAHDLNPELSKKMFNGGARKYKDFLYHVHKDKPFIQNYLKAKEPKKQIKILSKNDVEKVYAAAPNIRDRFMVRLLYETGLRIGEGLSLHIEDFQFDVKYGHRICLTHRGELMNGARLKSGERIIYISQELMDLFDDYLYQVLDRLELDSNFVFVKMRGKHSGQPMEYADVGAIFRALKKNRS